MAFCRMCRSDFNMYGVCVWQFCWPWSTVCIGPRMFCILYLCRPRFEPCAALENCYWISSCKQFLTVWNAYFWLLHFSAWKKKGKILLTALLSSDSQLWSVDFRDSYCKTCGCLPKSSYIWLHNYCLDTLLLFNMKLVLHLNLQLIYTDFLCKWKHRVWDLVSQMRTHCV